MVMDEIDTCIKVKERRNDIRLSIVIALRYIRKDCIMVMKILSIVDIYDLLHNIIFTI